MAAGPPPGGRLDMPAAPPGDARPTATVVKDIVVGTQTLVRQELELARLELIEGLATKGQAAGLAGAAGMLGLYVVGFLGLAAGAGLSLVMPAWAAWLVVAGALLLVMVVLLLVARSRATAAPIAPERTIQRVQEDVAWVRTLTRR